MTHLISSHNAFGHTNLHLLSDQFGIIIAYSDYQGNLCAWRNMRNTPRVPLNLNQSPIMNTRTNLVVVLAAALSAFAFNSLSAAPQTAVGYWASKITVNTWDTLLATSRTQTIAAGTIRATVLSLLGEPKQELAPDVYVYDNCRPDQSVAGGCQTLIVTFEHDEVFSLKFMNDAGVFIDAANAKVNHAVVLAKN